MVTSGTGSAEDIERLNAGTIIPFGNKEAFYKEVQNIYKNPEPYLKQGILASDYIKKNLSFNTRINEYKKIYENAIEKK